MKLNSSSIVLRLCLHEKCRETYALRCVSKEEHLAQREVLQIKLESPFHSLHLRLNSLTRFRLGVWLGRHI